MANFEKVEFEFPDEKAEAEKSVNKPAKAKSDCSGRMIGIAFSNLRNTSSLQDWLLQIT